VRPRRVRQARREPEARLLLEVRVPAQVPARVPVPKDPAPGCR